MGMLWYTHASVRILVVMYSINVFLTFTLSQLGMVRHWLQDRGPGWIHGCIVNTTGMLLTFGILLMTSIIKFGEGGWVTLLVTGIFIAVCLVVRQHYHKTLMALRSLNQVLGDLPLPEVPVKPEKQFHAPTHLPARFLSAACIRWRAAPRCTCQGQIIIRGAPPFHPAHWN